MLIWLKKEIGTQTAVIVLPSQSDGYKTLQIDPITWMTGYIINYMIRLSILYTQK